MDNDTTNQTNDPVNTSDDTQVDTITTVRDALTLTLDDDTFIKTAKKWSKESEAHFKDELHLETRREEIKTYRLGQQYAKEQLEDYESDHQDNLIWEGEAYLVPMAVARMPDIVVQPGNESDESVQAAEKLSKIVSTDIKSRERKKVLKLAFKHLPDNLIAIIKPFWNPEKGEHGDYDFKVVHPSLITLDHKAMDNDIRNHRFTDEICEHSVKDILMRFPKLDKTQLFDELRKTGEFKDNHDEKTTAGMNTLIKYHEFWFTWYEDKGDDQYEKVECVAWFYNDLVFDKRRSPNWDWEGEKRYFKYDEPLTVEDMQQSIMTGQDIEGQRVETYFRNHLEAPEKPYILIGYEQTGQGPMDETSRIEQAIKLQKSYDKRGRQVDDLIDNARVKNIWSTDAGMTQEQIEGVDMRDPKQDISVKGDPNKVHGEVKGELPSVPMINDKNELRKRLFDKLGVPGSVRGDIESDVATTNQIAREGAFTRNDDLADDTITYAAERMANWILHFIRLRYSEDHFKKTYGEDGKAMFDKINRDIVEDGQEVSIGASGTDKLKAEQKAMDMAKLNMVDPLTFYKDIGASDPRGRAEKLMLYTTYPDMYYQKYIAGNSSVSAMAGALNGATPGGATADPAADIAILQQGQIPQVPQAVDEAYIQAMTQFIDGPGKALAQQNPEFGQQLTAFMEQVVAVSQQSAQQPQAQPPGGQQPAPQQQPQGQPQPNGQAKVGPLASKPSPGNTNRVAAVPNSGVSSGRRY